MKKYPPLLPYLSYFPPNAEGDVWRKVNSFMAFQGILFHVSFIKFYASL